MKTILKTSIIQQEQKNGVVTKTGMSNAYNVLGNWSIAVSICHIGMGKVTKTNYDLVSAQPLCFSLNQ